MATRSPAAWDGGRGGECVIVFELPLYSATASLPPSYSQGIQRVNGKVAVAESNTPALAGVVARRARKTQRQTSMRACSYTNGRCRGAGDDAGRAFHNRCCTSRLIGRVAAYIADVSPHVIKGLNRATSAAFAVRQLDGHRTRSAVPADI